MYILNTLWILNNNYILEQFIHTIYNGSIVYVDATSEDVYAACRNGDETYLREWLLDPENDINTT